MFKTYAAEKIDFYETRIKNAMEAVNDFTEALEEAEKEIAELKAKIEMTADENTKSIYVEKMERLNCVIRACKDNIARYTKKIEEAKKELKKLNKRRR